MAEEMDNGSPPSPSWGGHPWGIRRAELRLWPLCSRFLSRVSAGEGGLCSHDYFSIQFSFHHFKVHAFLIVMNTMVKLIVLWLVYYI